MNKRTFYLAQFPTCFALVVVVRGAKARLVDAGLGCPDWPGCYGHLTVPEPAEKIGNAEPLFPDAPMEVAKGWAELAGLAALVSLALLVQVALGLSNAYGHLPLAVAVAHNAGGVLLLLTLVALNYYLKMARVRGTHLG